MTELMDIDEPTPAPTRPANAMAALMANAKNKGKQKEASVVDAREGLPWYVASCLPRSTFSIPSPSSSVEVSS